MSGEPTTLAAVPIWIVRHPMDALLRRWNYKSALLSALCRGQLFFLANLAAGVDAALAAFVTEACFRSATAGFYGALTQAFRRVSPPAHGLAGAVVLLPLVAHTLELLVHWAAGTARLATSIGASVAFSAVTTSFSLFAMRAGAFVVGEGSRPLADDLRAVPRLLRAYAGSIRRLCGATS